MATYPEYLKGLQDSFKKSKSHRAGSIDPRYQEMLKLYSSRSGATPDCADDPTNVNIVWSACESMLGIQDPNGGPWEYLATPRKRESVEPALIMESVLNYWVDRFRIFQEELKARQEMVVLGRGWLKVGWDFDAVRNDRHAVVNDFEVQAVLEHFAVLVAEGQLVPESLPTEAQVYRHLRKKYSQTRASEPWVRHIPWHEMYFDPECTRVDDARWIAQESWVPLQELKRDEQLSGKRREVVATGWTNVVKPWERGTEEHSSDSVMARVRKVELWDRQSHQLIIWVDGQEELVLFDGEWPYQSGDPFINYDCFEVPGTPWPIGVVELIAGQQIGLRRVREKMEDIRESIRTVVAIEEDALSDELIEAMNSDELLAFAKVPAAQDNRPLGAKIHTISPAVVPAEWFNADAQYQQDAEINIGLSSLFRGNALQGTHRTVAEISALTSSGQARLVPMVTRVQQGRTDIGRKLAALAAQFMDIEDVVPIRGMARLVRDQQEFVLRLGERGGFLHGEDMMFPFDRRSVEGEYDIKISTGSAFPVDRQTLLQDAMTMFNMLLPLPEFDRRRGIEFIVKNAFPGVAHVEDFLLDPQEVGQPVPLGSVPGGASAPGGNTGSSITLGGSA